MNFYKNGNYTVCIMNDGTKIRRTDGSTFYPLFAENTDVCITKKCNEGCPFCYEGCTKEGKHANLPKYFDLFDSLHPYTEMAINGNDLDHPDLLWFLHTLRDYKVFANITVHQAQFMNNYSLIKKLVEDKLIYGIGISYTHCEDGFLKRVKEFPNAVLHVINGIVEMDDLINIRRQGLKLLILGYKNIRRGKTFFSKFGKATLMKQEALKFNLPIMIQEDWFKVISFDNLAIEQLNIKELMSDEEWQKFYMGDDGQFTFYIDLVEGKFAKNSLSSERFDIGNKTIDEMFNIVRNVAN